MKRLTLLLVLLLALVASATSPRPKLVVGIVIEGLSLDYLDLLQQHFLDDGFNRLRTSGLTIENIDYGSNVDATAATAIALTGTSPSVNGIGGHMRFDIDHREAFPTFHHPATVGNFTNETFSPDALLVSTIADELRIDSRGQGTVVSVALEPDQALLLSAHAGNGAFWISDTNGNWASTTYYTDMPVAVSNINYRNPLKQRLDTMEWKPLFDPVLLPALSEQKRKNQFRHTFGKNDPDRFAAFKASALGNAEVTNLAIAILREKHLGTNANAIDMINVAYTLAPYSYGQSKDSSIETLDAYLRLDRDIARLLREARAVTPNLAIYVIGTPAAAHDKPDGAQWRIPSGEFSVKKALSLTNMYLMALHGQGNWVTDYYAGHFYLNKKLISERQLDLATLRAETAEFLSRMSGVANTYTIDDVIGLRLGENAPAIKRNTLISASGDVIIEVAPGWQITDDGSRKPPVVQRLAKQPNPAFIIAPSLKPQTISTPVDARRLAPTISRSVWLRPPNGASLQAIR